MAIAEMKLITVLGQLSNLDGVVSICGKSGVFEPDSAKGYYRNTEKFDVNHEDDLSKAQIKRIEKITYALGEKLELANIKGFEIDEEQISEYINYFYDNLDPLLKQKNSFFEKIKTNNQEIEEIKNFVDLKLNLKEILSCKFALVSFGKMPLEKLKNLKNQRNTEILYEVVKQDDTQKYCWIIYFATLENAKNVDRVFAKLSFEKINFKPFDGTVRERIDFLKHENIQIQKDIDKLEQKISAFWNLQKSSLMRIYSKLEELSEFFNIKKHAAIYNQNFVLTGWVPNANHKELCEKLNNIKGVECSVESGKNLLKHSPPIKLNNNRLVKPFEFFVETYGLPSYNEIDPTAFVAITYTLLFGIMFGDLGHGAVLAVVGYLLWKLKKMALGKILINCGICSSVFGLIFGEVFGLEHVLDPMFRRLGYAHKPFEIMAPSSTNLIIFASIGIGVVLLAISMVINMYSCFKKKNFGEMIFNPNGLCGLVFYISVVATLVSSLMLKSKPVNSLFVIIFIGIPLFLIMIKEILIELIEGKLDWRKVKWGDFLLQSFFELFEIVLSYFSNTMSFLRVGIFLLIHAGMMQAVVSIAEGFSTTTGALVVLIIGNAIVIGVEASLVGIQVLRLEFYELFSKYFEGQGRPFKPIVSKLKKA